MRTKTTPFAPTKTGSEVAGLSDDSGSQPWSSVVKIGHTRDPPDGARICHGNSIGERGTEPAVEGPLVDPLERTGLTFSGDEHETISPDFRPDFRGPAFRGEKWASVPSLPLLRWKSAAPRH